MMLYRYCFPSVLLSGILLRRYNRFLADIELDGGEIVVAHCVNTGRMEGLTLPGLRVWLTHCPSPKRKLHFTWEIAELPSPKGDILVGANTGFPNQVVRRMLEERVLPGFQHWNRLVPEKKYGENSRIDFWLQEEGREHFIEVKNCHLVYPDFHGYFPDSFSVRATKHLEELIEVVHAGHRATVLFTAQRADTICMRPSDVHDAAFAAAARRAAAAGVSFQALRIRPTPEAMIVEDFIPVDLEVYETTPMQAWMTANRAAAPAWSNKRLRPVE